MARYIDADKLPHIMGKALNEFDGTVVPISEVAIKMGHAIKEVPTADVAEVKHGHWMDNIETISTVGMPDIKAPVGYKCSECGRVEVCKEPYCNCGAKMDERSDT